MAIDSAAKRRSAVCTRRLPWFRRFQPAPDGSIDQGDRQQLAFVYRGILASAAEVAAAAQFFTLIGTDDRPFRLIGTADTRFSLIGTDDRPLALKG